MQMANIIALSPLFHERKINTYQVHINKVTSTTALILWLMASFVIQEISSCQVIQHISSEIFSSNLLDGSF